jgi:hypothetical protein
MLRPFAKFVTDCEPQFRVITVISSQSSILRWRHWTL